MKITRITVWQVDLPLHEGRYSWSGGNFIDVFDSTIVEIETDTGLRGYGECCPLGSVYLPAHAAGVRAGLREIGPRLLGADPLGIGFNQSINGRNAERPSVCQVGTGHGLLGFAGPSCRAFLCTRFWAEKRLVRLLSTGRSRNGSLPTWPPTWPATAPSDIGSFN